MDGPPPSTGSVTLLVPDEAEGTMLQVLVGLNASEEWVLKLYVNDRTPAAGDTEADYTEASGFGYAAIPLVAASWVLTLGGPSWVGYPQQTFTFTGALGLLYGYYLVQASSGKIMGAERFPDPLPEILVNGDYVKVTPRFTLGSVFGD